jgi:putative AlgH/UPF0301 family transcriptional regulator
VTGPGEPPPEQRLVFGEVAQTYDQQRPSYPSQFIDSVLAFAGLKWRPGQAERIKANDWVVAEIEASGLFEPGLSRW